MVCGKDQCGGCGKYSKKCNKPRDPEHTITLFGNGADGDFSDVTTGPNSIFVMDRDYYFNNLELVGIIVTNGFRIYVRNCFTPHSTAIIDHSGSDGQNIGGGAGATFGTLGGGFNGGSTNNPAQNATLPTAGGRGGFGVLAGGTPGFFNINSGGVTTLTPTGTTVAVNNNPVLYNAYPQNTFGRDLNGTVIAGGTGGGGSIIALDGTGGGGGGGGGTVGIFAYRVRGRGTISAVGGNGFMNPGVAQNSFATGGGGGGVIIIVYAKGDISCLKLNVKGGTPGGVGQVGEDGRIYINRLSLP